MRTAGILDFGAGASRWTGKRAKGCLGQGSSIVRQCCLAAGLEVEDLHVAWRKVDVLMVGLFWWEHLYDLIGLLAMHGIEPLRSRRRSAPLVFVGGQLPSYNPGPFREIADLACIGDGEEAGPAALRILLAGGSPHDCLGIPGIYVSDADNCAEWQQVEDISSTVRWPFHNRVSEAGTSGVRKMEIFERRLELARGCRRKCSFCGVGWTKKYRELPTMEACKAIRGTPGAVKGFAPDPAAHSGWPQIQAAYRAAGKFNQARDISTRVILQHGFGTSHVYTTGIDGLSERLRAALHKPLTEDELASVFEIASAHMGSLGVYQILDLPGESDEDYVGWFSTLARIRLHERPPSKRYHGPPGGFFVFASLNAFSPTPHTPLQWEGVHVEVDLSARYNRALEALGPMEGRLLRHKILGRPHGPASRLLESAVLRGEPDLTPFYLSVAAQRPKLTTTAQIFELARRLGLENQLRSTTEAKPMDRPLPWECRVRPLFGRDTLLAARVAYHRRLTA